MQIAVLAALTVAGGAIVTFWGFTAGWLAETGLCALGTLVAVAMTEPPPTAEDEAARTPQAPQWRPASRPQAGARSWRSQQPDQPSSSWR